MLKYTFPMSENIKYLKINEISKQEKTENKTITCINQQSKEELEALKLPIIYLNISKLS